VVNISNIKRTLNHTSRNVVINFDSLVSVVTRVRQNMTQWGWLAQWLRHWPVKQEVSGSNPGGGK